jgi:hypothetical protein
VRLPSRECERMTARRGVPATDDFRARRRALGSRPLSPATAAARRSSSVTTGDRPLRE